MSGRTPAEPTEVPEAAHDPAGRKGDAPQVIASRSIYRGAVVELRVDEVRLGDKVVTREVVEHPGAVVVAAVDREGRVALARQYRHPIGHDLLEFPAGGLEPEETPLQTARRELREEMGLEATEWLSLGSFFSSPGFVHEEMHAFLATGLRPTSRDLDDDEEIDVVWLRLEDLASGEVRLMDAKTLATLHLLRTSGAVTASVGAEGGGTR